MPAPRTTILALARHIGGFYYGELLTGLMREVTAQGGRIVVAQTAPISPETEDLIDYEFSFSVAWAEVDAVVAIGLTATDAFVERLISLGKPVVLTSQRVEEFETPAALPDNHGGVRLGVEHLLAHGHTRIGFVADTRPFDYRERYRAYLDVMHENGLPTDGLLYPATDWSEAGGDSAAEAILAAHVRPTAVMTASGYNALGVIRTMAAAGLNVPDDLAVLAYDNVDQGTFATPSLSSVHQRFDEVGALAGRLVMDMTRGGVVAPGVYVAAGTALVPRGSCGCRNDVFDPRDRAVRTSTGVPVWPGELGQLMHSMLDERHHGTVDEAAVGAVVDGFAKLLTRGARLTESEVRAFVSLMRASAPHNDTLHEMTCVLTDHVQRLECSGTAGGRSPDAAGLSRIAAALWQLQNHGSVTRSHELEDHLLEGSDVASALLQADARAARDLAWMVHTHARAGTLAMWDDASPDSPLRLAGVYDADGLIDQTIGTEIDVTQFPPAELVAAAHAEEGEVCFVVPIRSANRRWGVLAVLGVINNFSSRDTSHHWATLLAAVFDGEELEITARASEERYAAVARASNDGLWELDLAAATMYLSSRCRDVLGLAPDAQIDPARWNAAIHPDDQERVRDTFATAYLHADMPVEVEYRISVDGDAYRWVLSRGLGVAGTDTTTVRLVGSLADIHPRKALEEQLRQGALYDALTGLPNRRLFLERLAAAVARHNADPRWQFAVIFLDLDGFKLINDSLGHLMGDELLKTIGDRLRTHLRSIDTAARFGGDEFAVLLSDPDPDEVLVIAHRIQELISATVPLGGHDVAVTASVGVSSSSSDYEDAEDVLRDADIAMYDAKGTDRGSASVFDPEMHVRAAGRLRERGELRTALERHEFVVHYQPVVALDGTGLQAFEALVRWEHPERGLLLPGDFLPAMCDNATILTLGSWILDEVCRQIAQWTAIYERPVTVAVNVSHREFWARNLVRAVTEVLDRHAIPAHCLILEITESVIMADPEPAREVMADLRALGVRLHIDDFGTGQSSLTALRTLPVDALKIDGSFVRELGIVDQTTQLVRIILEMGRALDLEVVAECVETPDQVRILRSLGCMNVQGWLYGRAMPGAAAGALLGVPLAAPDSQHDVPRAHTAAVVLPVGAAPGR